MTTMITTAPVTGIETRISGWSFDGLLRRLTARRSERFAGVNAPIDMSAQIETQVYTRDPGWRG